MSDVIKTSLSTITVIDDTESITGASVPDDTILVGYFGHPIPHDPEWVLDVRNGLDGAKKQRISRDEEGAIIRVTIGALTCKECGDKGGKPGFMLEVTEPRDCRYVCQCENCGTYNWVVGGERHD